MAPPRRVAARSGRVRRGACRRRPRNRCRPAHRRRADLGCRGVASRRGGPVARSGHALCGLLFGRSRVGSHGPCHGDVDAPCAVSDLDGHHARQPASPPVRLHGLCPALGLETPGARRNPPRQSHLRLDTPQAPQNRRPGPTQHKAHPHRHGIRLPPCRCLRPRAPSIMWLTPAQGPNTALPPTTGNPPRHAPRPERNGSPCPHRTKNQPGPPKQPKSPQIASQQGTREKCGLIVTPQVVERSVLDRD